MMHRQEQRGFYLDACDSDNDIVDKWETMMQTLFTSVQIDTAIVLVLLIVKSHCVASFSWGLWE